MSMILNERIKTELPFWLWRLWKARILLLNDCSLAEGAIVIFLSEALWLKWTHFSCKGHWAQLGLRWVAEDSGGFIKKVRSESGLLTCCCTSLQSECAGPTVSYEWSQGWKKTEEMDLCQAWAGHSYFSKMLFVRKAQLCSGKRTRGNAAVRCVMSGFSQYPLPGYNSLDKILEEFYSVCKA